ncbi:MAG: hypothetical protein R2883_03350 [Caldisericia bacterium]
MSFIRTKKIDFHAIDSRCSKGDKAEIHGISMGEFRRIQEILIEGDENSSESFKSGNDANLEMVTLATHSLTVGGEKMSVSKETLSGLDALYFNLLLAEVMEFHSFTNSEKN